MIIKMSEREVSPAFLISAINDIIFEASSISSPHLNLKFRQNWYLADETVSPPWYTVWDVRGWVCWAESRLGGTSCSHLPLCCERAQECQNPLPPLTAVWTHTHTHTQHRCSTHTSNIQWQTETDILTNALNLYSQHRLQGEYIIFFM